MKRMHVHVAVDDLTRHGHSALLRGRRREARLRQVDAGRSARKFAISTRGRAPGLDHLGIQVENQDELHEVYARLRQAGGNVIEQGQTACCYAKSEKSWIDDPAGISWETFHTRGENTDYGDGTGERTARLAHEQSCCAPEPKVAEPAAACGCPVA